ncbi:MAG: Crp/Fnr family transcriptional regulator [Candidatus Saccharimonadales bacterium]
MTPHKLITLLKSGVHENHAAGDVFHALDFAEELYIVESGYVKRYSMDQKQVKIIESIYGPGYLFPLSPIYKKLFDMELSQDDRHYVYQAMTDLEIKGISMQSLEKALDEDPELYRDLFLEAGVRLKANINRLTSNALSDESKKVVHQLVCLADEFGTLQKKGVKTTILIKVPLENVDIAEQLNLSREFVDETISMLQSQELISISDHKISISDLDLLKDAYL